MTLNKKIEPKALSGYSQIYWLRRQEWIDALNLYEPVPFVLGTYLRRNKKEDNAEYGARLSKLCQINYVYNAVDFYRSMLWSTSVEITAEGPLKASVDAFVKKCNRRGEDFRTFMRERATPLQLLFGSCDIFCDLPRVSESEAPISLWEQQQRGLDLPYCYAVPPLNRLQWVNDEAGNFSFYKSMDVIDKQIGPALDIGQLHQYNLWTVEEVYKYDQDGNQVSVVANPYGFIPVTTIAPLGSIRFQDKELGVSIVQDLVPLQVNLLNALSEMFDFHHFANFPQLVINRDTTVPTPPMGEEGESIEVGMHRLLELLGKDSDAKWISPDAQAILAKQAFIFESIVPEIYCTMLIPPAQIKTHTSENTIRTNLQQLYTRLTAMAQHLAVGMKRVIETALKVQGYSSEQIEDASVEVAFNTNWSFEAFMDSVQELEQTRKTIGDLTKTAIKEMAKRVVNSKLYNSAQIQQIHKEIDEAEMEDGEDADAQDEGAEVADESNSENVKKEQPQKGGN